MTETEEKKSFAQKLNQATFLDAGGMKTNLFGCLTDLKGCAITCFCPCLVSGTTRTVFDEREWGLFDCICMASPYVTRQSMRHKYNLPRDDVKDCLHATCCMWCMIHQNVRELAEYTDGVNHFTPPPPQKMQQHPIPTQEPVPPPDHTTDPVQPVNVNDVSVYPTV